jgi:hypothetical protein
MTMKPSVITTRLLPWYLVGAYRLVPGRIRGSRAWPGSRGPSSSHMALDLMSQGADGWLAVRSALGENFWSKDFLA